MATAVHTTVVSRSNQQLTNAIWADQIMDNGNQLAGAHRNLLTNGGFEIWQRGAGPFTTTSTYTADRWMLVENASTCQVDREGTTVDGSTYSLKLGISAFAGDVTIVQRIEDLTQLRGKTLSLSVRCHQSVASRVTARIVDNAFAGASAASATTGAFVVLAVSYAVPAGATTLDVVFQVNGTGTFYLDNAMLTVGPAPAPYQPLHPQEDLARCQRYYEVHGGVASPYPDLQMRAGAAEALHHSYAFAVPKAVIPTMTKNGTWAVSNCGQPSVVGFTTTGYTLSATATGAGLMAFNPNSADDTIVAEANV